MDVFQQLRQKLVRGDRQPSILIVMSTCVVLYKRVVSATSQPGGGVRVGEASDGIGRNAKYEREGSASRRRRGEKLVRIYMAESGEIIICAQEAERSMAA